MNKQEIQESVVMTDREVIERVLNGEKEHYAILVRRNNQRLYRAAMAILDNDADVEDAMQTAYIHAYENLGKFGFRSGFSTWLTRILINECLLLKKKRAKFTELKPGHMENGMQHQSTAPAARVLRAELGAILEKAIRKLPEKYRTVFVLRELEDMNVKETQVCLDISEENVKVRLNRARAMLKTELAGYYNKEDIFLFHLDRCDRLVNAVMRNI